MSDPATALSDDDLELVAQLRLVLARLGRQLRQNAGSGLTPSQQSTLASIDAHGPISLGDLATLEQVAPPTVTRAVTRLESDGFVERAPGTADRRVTIVTTTAPGRRVLDRSRSRRSAWLAQQLAVCECADRELLRASLPALQRLASGGA